MRYSKTGSLLLSDRQRSEIGDIYIYKGYRAKDNLRNLVI